MTPLTLRIRELREVKDWSQAELARRSGVDQAIISRLESGETQSINLPNLEKLAKALGVRPGLPHRKEGEVMGDSASGHQPHRDGNKSNQHGRP